MRHLGLLFGCITLLSGQVSPTRAELDERLRKLHNEIAQDTASTDDLTNRIIKQLSQALDAARASGDTAQAAKTAKSLEELRALASARSGKAVPSVDSPEDAPLEPAKALAGSKPANSNGTTDSAAGWSYMLLRFTISDRSVDEVEQLNTAGQRGFELVSVVQSGNERLFYLKRPVR
jgi:hypothetical protein